MQYPVAADLQFHSYFDHVPSRFQGIHREFFDVIYDLDHVAVRPNSQTSYIAFVDGLRGHVLQVKGTAGHGREEDDLIAIWNPAKLGDAPAAMMYKASWSNYAETPADFHSSIVVGGLRAVGVPTMTQILISLVAFIRS